MVAVDTNCLKPKCCCEKYIYYNLRKSPVIWPYILGNNGELLWLAVDYSNTYAEYHNIPFSSITQFWVDSDFYATWD